MGFVLSLEDLNRTDSDVAGGKGANLGELIHVPGTHVPVGFCITTDAFRRVMEEMPSVDVLLGRLSSLAPDRHDELRRLGAEIREAIAEHAVPDDVASDVTGALARFGEQQAWAVRSSATAEDLPSASFAGQQDSFLNVVGRDSILRAVTRCWASLFTERAVAYRVQKGFDHRTVRMAVVVQQMVFPQAAGMMFTADPLTSDRTAASVEATFGLGEALVSGAVIPDVYTVRGTDITATISSKHHSVESAPDGGTRLRDVSPDRRFEAVLSDEQILRLVKLGREIESHFGCPQDIEWCLVDDEVHIVQSRPITTLFPIPVSDDDEQHVYVSVGHQQMMTDAMKPLGISVWQMTSPAPMRTAGGRLFVDVTEALSSPLSRESLVEALGASDPLLGDALRVIVARRGFVPGSDAPAGDRSIGVAEPIDADPEVVTELIARSESSLAELKREIRGRAGTELIEFVETDIQELRRILFDPRSLQVITAAMDSARWLSDRLDSWLGERDAADTLAQSVPHNVTSEMGLALLDVADRIRLRPDVVAFLRHVEESGHDDETFLDDLGSVAGGGEARAAIEGFLGTYGMRCAGEIDITRPRWSDRPTARVPVIAGNVDNFTAGAAQRRFEQGRRAAETKEREVLERLRALPDGERKADETGRMIARLRTFSGYREYPKYGMVARYFVYKQALSNEAARLVQDGVLRRDDDIFYLTYDELREVVRTHRGCDDLVRDRRRAFAVHETLTPPRVLTSDGEALSGEYRREDVPEGAVPGTPVSAGVVEGRARVVSDMARADLRAGDILVTAYTDPSWTPLFVSIKGLVTEVGGLMTHGAVIAREYGVPAVVGVQHATRLIRDGQRIRVNGSEGYVEFVSEPGA